MRFVLLLPLWLVLAIGEPSLVHSCPTHGAAALQHDATPPDAHAAHAHSPANSPTPKKHSCTCIGCCTIAGAAVLPVPPVVVVVEVAITEPTTPDAPSRVSHRDAHLLLPYANGPPA